jgi:hypothetical protein
MAGRTVRLALDRCRIDGNSGDGVNASYINFGYIELDFTSCSLSANGQDGFAGVLSNGLGNSVLATFVRCTLAHNGAIAVRSLENAPQHHRSELDSCTVYGNADDLLHNGTITARFCDIGDGDFAGQDGNFSADPLFVDPAMGDFGLRVGSPCVDAGNPALGQDPDCTPVEVGAFALLSPRAYCTSKPSSCGTLPLLTAAGTPSASATSGFTLSATRAKGQKLGLLIYTDAGPALPAAPFQGGWLCLASPVRRSIAVADMSGTPGLCDGVLALDLNAFAAGLLGGNPLPSLRVAGTTVNAQFWGRDLPGVSLLTDALEFVLCP